MGELCLIRLMRLSNMLVRKKRNFFCEQTSRKNWKSMQIYYWVHILHARVPQTMQRRQVYVVMFWWQALKHARKEKTKFLFASRRQGRIERVCRFIIGYTFLTKPCSATNHARKIFFQPGAAIDSKEVDVARSLRSVDASGPDASDATFPNEQRAPLKIRLPAVEVHVIVKKTAPTSINMAEGRRQRLLDGSEPNI